MRLGTRIVATALFAGAALVGTRAGANEVGFLAFEKIGEDPATVFLRADVGPMYDGANLTVKFGPEFDSGFIVGVRKLTIGPNVIAVPNFPENGWYTGRVKSEIRGIEDWDAGEN